MLISLCWVQSLVYMAYQDNHVASSKDFLFRIANMSVESKDDDKTTELFKSNPRYVNPVVTNIYHLLCIKFM